MFTVDAINLAMAATDTIALAFKTPPEQEKTIHIYQNFIALASGHMDIVEGPTWTTNTGLLVPIFNRYREATMDASIVLEDKTATPNFTATGNIILDPTALTGGTILRTIYGFGKKDKAPSTRDEAHGWILAADTTYAFLFTADDGSNKAQLTLNWAETII